MVQEFRILAASRDHVVAHSSSLVLAVWKRHTLITHLADVQAGIDLAREMNGLPICVIQIVPREAVVPGPATRRALATLLRENTDNISHSAVIQLGSGFRASIVRSIVTAVTLMSNPGYPHQVFSSIPDACSWMEANIETLRDCTLSSRVDDFYNASLTMNGRAPAPRPHANL